MSNTTITSGGSNGLGMMAAAPAVGSHMRKGDAPGTWFEALASAWGQTLDSQASTIDQMSQGISQGGDNPSQITALTAESMRMSFLSQSSSSSIDSVGKALETMARKN